MFFRLFSFTLGCLFLDFEILLSKGFQVPAQLSPRAFGSTSRPEISCEAGRRDVLSTLGGVSSMILLPAPPSRAEEDNNLTTQLFNPDGSLKAGAVEEAKQRLIQFEWGVSDQLALSEDGVNSAETQKGSDVRVSYDFPEKWSDGKNGDAIYFDKSEGLNAKACKRITVYQAPGTADLKRLEKATTIGVAKALDVPDSLKRLYKADIISGRVAKRNDQTYYEFDMATAPETCEDSKENLGLGFCPYDNVFLLSATIIQDRLYCIAVECNSTKIWKVASSDLKRVRSSFIVEAK